VLYVGGLTELLAPTVFVHGSNFFPDRPDGAMAGVHVPATWPYSRSLSPMFRIPWHPRAKRLDPVVDWRAPVDGPLFTSVPGYAIFNFGMFS